MGEPMRIGKIVVSAVDQLREPEAGPLPVEFPMDKTLQEIIPERFHGADLAHFKPSDFSATEPHYLALDRLPPPLRRGESDGLLICGPLGVGKTHLAAAVLKALVPEQIEARFVGWWKAATLLFTLQVGGFDDRMRLLTSLRNASLVVLDDVGAERENAAASATLLMLIDERLEMCRPTIITTNVRQDEMQKRERRLWDRLKTFEVVVLQGESRRTRRMLREVQE